MNIKPTLLLAPLVWFLTTRLSVEAQTAALDFNLVARYQFVAHQHVGGTNSNTFVSTTKTIRITNKHILALLETAYQTNAGAFTTNGFKLALWNSDFVIVDKQGTILHNASNDGFFTPFTFGDTSGVSEERFISDLTSNISGTYVHTGQFFYNDAANGNSFSFGGLQRDRYHSYFESTNMYHNVFHNSQHTTMTGAGAGDIEKSPFPFGPTTHPGNVVLTGVVKTSFSTSEEAVP